MLKKLPLQLDSTNVSSLQSAKRELTKSYAAVEVYSESFVKTTALWLTSNFCSKLRVLKFSFMEFKCGEGKLLRKTFQALHELEELTMHQCDLLDFPRKIETTTMTNLKSITFFATHLGVSLMKPRKEATKVLTFYSFCHFSRHRSWRSSRSLERRTSNHRHLSFPSSLNSPSTN